MDWKKLSKKKKAYILAFATVLSLLVWAFISAGIITHNFNRTQVSGQKDKQEALINGIILTETKDDRKYWEIYGETGNYDSTDGIALLDNCIGNFYDENNEVSMSFESSKGTYSEDRKQIIMYNNTRIVIKDGTILEADRLTWSGSDEPIIAKGDVKITRGSDFFATADMVEISPDYDNFKIVGHAVSRMYDSKER